VQRGTLTFAALTVALFSFLPSAVQNGSSVSHVPLICRIWTETQSFSRRDPAVLHVSVENTTGQDINITGIEVRLSRVDRSDQEVLHGTQRTYWSWIDPETKLPLKITFNARKGELSRPEKKLTLHAKRSVEFVVDLAKFEWTDELSSTAPPTGSFYGVVREGAYTLSLSLNALASGGHPKFESNQVSVEIHGASK